MDLYYPKLPNKKIDCKKRKIPIEYPEKYNKIFISNIIKYIPKVYIEYFDHLMNKVLLYEPEKKIFHVSTIGNLFLRFTIAKYTENGAKLNYYQHGGFYGEFKHHNAHDYESSIADQFMTWGWKIKENDLPSPAFRLEKFRENFNENNEKSIDLLLIYPGIFNINDKHFKRISSIFFININRVKFTKICARPRPKSTFNRKADLMFISKEDVKIDSGYTPLSKLISKSKLVILMNHPSTTILECLYVDHPVVALLDNDDPSAIVIPYYDLLLEKKLFHLTIDSLIEHLNTTNINAWWSTLLKDPTYQQFKHEFLRKV
jgi:putative transferase (TIGR04331 family)